MGRVIDFTVVTTLAPTDLVPCIATVNGVPQDSVIQKQNLIGGGDAGVPGAIYRGTQTNPNSPAILPTNQATGNFYYYDDPENFTVWLWNVGSGSWYPIIE